MTRICSLKLAQKLLPTSIKKNVGAISEYFDIPIQSRHRAFDDAFATAIFFIEMLQILTDRYDFHYVEEIIEFQNSQTKKSKIDNKYLIILEKYKNLAPNIPGIVSFIGKNHTVLHIEKALNIKHYFDWFLECAINSAPKLRKVLRLLERIE